MQGSPQFSKPPTAFGIAGPQKLGIIGGASIFDSGPIAISSAQLLAMNVTPVPILPAPGAGLALVVLQTVYDLMFNSIAYAVTTLPALVYASSGSNFDANPVTGFWSAGASNFIARGPFATAFAPSTVINNAVVLSGRLTTGNGSLSLRVLYRILPLS